MGSGGWIGGGGVKPVARVEAGILGFFLLSIFRVLRYCIKPTFCRSIKKFFQVFLNKEHFVNSNCDISL